MHIANRHVERWAPESNASRVRSMRSLGFVDRLVSPWLETAQRSIGLRMFSSPTHQRGTDRETPQVSWVFPRPWYQDELDWMAAAREASMYSESAPAPSMLTTRGTYVTPQQQVRPASPSLPTVMPAALYEYVAPSLSIAQPTPRDREGAFAAPSSAQAYSPLVSLAAVQAAELMNRAVAPLVASASPSQTQQPAAAQLGRIAPSLRTVLTTMLERAAAPSVPAAASTRVPEMVTPPAPTEETTAPSPTPAMTMAEQVATDLHTQRVQMAQVQAIAQQQAAVRAAETQQRVEAEIRQRVEQRVAERAPVAPIASATPVAASTARSAAPTTPTTTTPPTPTTATTPATTAAAPLSAAEVERVEHARIEERVLQRVAERVAAQRLHEAARAEAAVHARSLEEPREAPAPTAAPAQPPAEVLAAIASLPPQLASVLSASVLSEVALQQPGGALRAIAQVNEALRTAELIARGAASNTAFEPTRGPRVVMPAGLGGLVTTVERAHGPTMLPAMPMPMATDVTVRPQAERAPERSSYRVPTLPWSAAAATPAPMLAAPSSRAAAPTSALAAATTTSPQALTHVAWADRWLARFAGASPRSLEAMQVASSSSPLLQLASAAPEAVFLAALFDDKPATATTRDVATSAIGAAPSAPGMPRLIVPPPPPVQRFDDSAETPDDVFAQISAAATRSRKPAVAASTQPTPAQPATTFADQRPTYADHVAHAVPAAPHAGLAAQLASSPFAPALRHVLALPSAQAFDVRSLFGGGLSATYLAGLLSASTHEMAVASPLPAWAQWSPVAEQRDAVAPSGERAVPGFAPAYVAPDVIGPDAVATGTTIATTSEALAPTALARPTELAPLTTVRSALLSWTGDMGSPFAPTVESVASQTLASSTATAPSPLATGLASPMATPSPARAMLESMSMPMVGETEPSAIGGWTAPGAIADRAFGYSLAHERSTADLSFDFVPPELVLAARVYGLGPAEAAQAARLALAGPGQLTAMANTVDRTFVNAMAIDADRRERAAITTAYPSRSGDVQTNLDLKPAVAPSMPVVAPSAAAPVATTSATPTLTTLTAETPSLIGSASHSAFGVDRRAPRGAFLWPAATVAALGLTASTPDGAQSMSVAALELLAAQAVAEIGTYAALDDGAQPETQLDTSVAPTHATLPSTTATPSTTQSPALAARGETAASGEPAEADILGTASTMIAPSRRARFDALYVALSQSPSGRSLSPAARAARALALAGRGDDAAPSAFERAATVWDVLPVVYATEGMSTEEAVQTQAELGANTARGVAARAALRRPGLGIGAELVAPDVEARPGLAPLSSRAGEALSSYVTSVAPTAVPLGATSVASSGGAPSATPSAHRAPAAIDLVQTGRPAGRHGGGEAEIPPWFEAAARKMLGERMGNDGISMAELTLVNSAPATQIAAASKTGHVHAAPKSPGAGSGNVGESKKGDGDDIDAIAEEVYSKIMVMMDAARSRNGEPYL